MNRYISGRNLHMQYIILINAVNQFLEYWTFLSPLNWCNNSVRYDSIGIVCIFVGILSRCWSLIGKIHSIFQYCINMLNSTWKSWTCPWPLMCVSRSITQLEWNVLRTSWKNSLFSLNFYGKWHPKLTNSRNGLGWRLQFKIASCNGPWGTCTFQSKWTSPIIAII